MKCKDCVHWKQNTFYENVKNEGYCDSKLGDKVTIELEVGWDGGVVGYVETEEDFFCGNFTARNG